LLAICRPSGCTVAYGVVVVVVVVVVGVCNRSQMRTSKCTCLFFGVSIGLDPGEKCTKGIFGRSKFKVTRDIIADHLWMASSWSIAMTVSVCLSVCLSARITRKLHGRTLPICCACCPWPWLWRRCDTLCTSGFVDGVMFSQNGPTARYEYS